MWFDIVASSLGFFGSIIFSAGLIKGRQQILDENSTYLDANPFTLRAELRSQPYYILGLGVIIIGFATSIGGNISKYFEHNQVVIGLLTVSALSFLGFFGMAIFYIIQTKSHQSAKVKHRKKIFASSLRRYSGIMRGYDGQVDEKESFSSSKDMYQKELLAMAESIPEPDNEREMTLIQAIGSSQTAYQFYEVSKMYLDER